jgi:hypothetical protein
MTRKSLVILLLLMASWDLSAQVFIGLEKGDVIKSMKKEYPAYRCDDDIKNEKYNYIKFYSEDETETWIVVFDKEDRCTSVRITCEMSQLANKRNELDSLYTKKEADSWIINLRTGDILIQLKNETWFFTITYRPAPKL